MRSVTLVLLILGAHLACAGTHSLKYYYTAVSGDIDFPEFIAVGVVNEVQYMYFDSNTMKAVPKTEWMKQNEGADFWDSLTQDMKAIHQHDTNNVKMLKERFNQSKGVHTYQVFYSCDWDEQTEAKHGVVQLGYDGEDLMSLNYKEMRYTSPVAQGFPIVQKFNNDRDRMESIQDYLSFECIKWLQKFWQYGKSSLQKTVSPQVSLLQKTPSSPVKCHATGFYPSGVIITWMKNGQEHHEDVELGELLHNEDGTFQKTSTLRVTPDEWKKNEFSCVVEHQGKTVTEKDIRTTGGNFVPIYIVVVLAAVVVLILIGVVVYKKSSGSDGSNSSAQAVPLA